MILNSPPIFSRIRFSLIIVITLQLTGCDNHNFSDLQNYIASIKVSPQAPIKPLPDFKIVEPFVFKFTENLRDPFKPVEKIKTAAEQEVEIEEPDNGIHPDASRIKEPLEAFTISGIRMVGTVNMKSVLWGLVKNENTIYRVKIGNYLGKNDGIITHIYKDKIDIIEIMPNKPGRFVEQPTTLTLAE
ncbi:MAG: pilus assembly protein PilP [Methylococcaceae bacterium]